MNERGSMWRGLYWWIFLPAFSLFLGYQALTFFHTFEPSRPVTVMIPRGANLGSISQKLHQAGVLESSWKFKLLTRLES